MILRIARGKVGHRQTPIQQNPIQLITEWGFVLLRVLNGFVAQMSSRKSDPKPQTELCHSHRHRGAQLGKPIQQSGPYL